ncbi:MAG: hypothetical protein H6889_11980 [Brucellaceae bacterium]|nr:hypothetical protein [Brucellaceae bacterium]
MKKMLAAASLLLGTLGLALAAEGGAVIDPPARGSVSAEQGLAAFDRIFAVVSHPRCANCHVGPDNVPMWSGPSYGKAGPHGMNINAGASRIGAESLACATCHTTLSQDREGANATPHAAPRVALEWRLAPVEFQWFGKSKAEICAQLSDPERTGGRDAQGLADHLAEDAGHGGFVKWGWQPGGTREAAPYTLQDHVNDVLAWGAAGTPCPQD